MQMIDRYRGALLGLAAGDALGITLEFNPPGSFTPIADMVGGGPFRLKPGQWTDDTSLALCLAESLMERHGFDPVDQLTRYVRWWKEGHLSSTGECFDIGTTTSAALRRFQTTGEPYCGSTETGYASNGSIMRLVPVPLFYAEDPAHAIEKSGESSRITHGAPECVNACRYFGGLIVGAVLAVSKEELLSANYAPVKEYWTQHPLSAAIAEVAAGSFKHREPPQIQGLGYVVSSLEAALWAFHKTNSFQDGALLAVNLGDDADTTGAVYGQLAGAYYGESGIPAAWLSKLAMRERIASMAESLYTLAKTG